jgi:hypothetical protein
MYLQLEGDESTSVTQKRMPNQREQYGGTVHLFIGTGHILCKITFMPFTFDNNSIVIYRGLNSLFIFKSVSFFAAAPKLSCLHLRRCINLRIILVCCDADLSPKIPVHTLYSRNTVKSCFWGPSEAEGPQHLLTPGAIQLIRARNTTAIARIRARLVGGEGIKTWSFLLLYHGIVLQSALQTMFGEDFLLILHGNKTIVL